MSATVYDFASARRSRPVTSATHNKSGTIAKFPVKCTKAVKQATTDDVEFKHYGQTWF